MENHQRYAGFGVIVQWSVYRYLEGYRNNEFTVSDRLVRFLTRLPCKWGLIKE
jgi:hypothetical protein